MALQMATNITPDTFSGVGGAVFDATKGLQVRWQVNGNSPLLAYRVVLQENDANSTELYNTGKVTLDAPFYGIDYKGEARFFAANEISAATLATATITNGNAYKMLITQWWGATDEQSVTQSSAALIEAWSEPVVTIGTIPAVLNSRKHSFTASYTQAEGDAIEWVRWQLAEADKTDAPFHDTGNIYGTAELRLDYARFFTGNRYAVRCEVQSQSGQTADSGWQTFDVSFPVNEPTGVVEVKRVYGDNGISVSWQTARSTEGTAQGKAEIKDGILALGNNASVLWNTENDKPISYAAPYTVMWKGNPRLRNGNTLYSIQTETGALGISIAADSSTTATVICTFDGETIGEINITTPDVYMDRTWAVIVTPTEMHVQYLEGIGGLHPDTNLYPDTDLFPQPNTGYDISTWQTSLTYTQSAISSVELLGAQSCDYLWIEGRAIDGSEMDEIMADADYEPEWAQGSTWFLASFTDGLNAGNLDTKGYTLYRLNKTTGEYLHLLDMSIDQLAVIDYGAKNNNEYVYHLYYADENAYTASPLSSRAIIPMIWDYVILACDMDENGIYHVQRPYYFSCNIESGDVSNNNTPQTQKNFTRYPVWTPDSSLYRSGTLKAFIGTVNHMNNMYHDTADYANELMALSHTGHVLFFKDRKGNLCRIRINGPITTKVDDKLPNQPVTISIPWVEVGPADGVSIVATRADPGWTLGRFNGKSVYDIWLDAGNKGDEEAFLASLKGEKGDIMVASFEIVDGDLYMITPD